MKKAADEQKERQEMIKEQKKQGSNMSSYVERVIDFLERLAKNQNLPKALLEDVEWAIKTISTNKLYRGQLGGFKLSNDREDVKAWTDMIRLASHLINNKNEGGHVNVVSQDEHVPKRPTLSRDNTSSNLLKQMENKDELHRRRLGHAGRVKETQDETDEFFEIVGETDVTIYENILEKVDETQFDAFAFVQIVNEKSFQYLMYKLLSMNNLLIPFHIPLKKL